MPQTEQTRAEWLAGLKVGDEVAVNLPMSGRCRIARIKEENQSWWWIDGKPYIKESGVIVHGQDPWIIRPVTDEVRANVHRYNVCDEFWGLASRPLDTYSTATLEAAIAALKGEGNAD